MQTLSSVFLPKSCWKRQNGLFIDNLQRLTIFDLLILVIMGIKHYCLPSTGKSEQHGGMPTLQPISLFSANGIKIFRNIHYGHTYRSSTGANNLRYIILILNPKEVYQF